MIRFNLLLPCAVLLSACNANPVIEKDKLPVIDHYRIGEQAYRSGEMQRAKIHFEAIITKQPANMDAHFRLGNIAMHEKRYSVAGDHYREVLKRKPAHKKTHYNLAITYIIQAENHLNYYSAISDDSRFTDSIVELLSAIKRFSKATHKSKNILDELADILSVNNK